MALIASLKASWYLGRGSRAEKRCKYELALRYFLCSLDNARKTNDVYEIPVHLEAVAQTFLHLKQYDNAKIYATECQEIYRKLSQEDKTGFFKKSLERANNLLDVINLSEEQDQQKK